MPTAAVTLVAPSVTSISAHDSSSRAGSPPVWFDGAVRQTTPEELGLGDHTVPVFDQVGEHVEHLRLDVHQFAAA